MASHNLKYQPSRELLEQTRDRISSLIRRTPVLTSDELNRRSQAQLFFKCENTQITGSFKMRGAANAVFSMTEVDRANGVTAHSSGNFAQAVARAAQLAEVKAHIVMPHNAPEIKKRGVQRYAGDITLCEPTIEAREASCQAIVEKTGAAKLHPSNQWEVILGQATAAMELLDEVPDLDALVVPVGGGGLLAGTALAGHFFGKSGIDIYAGEPARTDDAYRSLRSGKIETNDRVDTAADGLRTTLGDVNFPIIMKYVRDIIRVEEEEIISSLLMCYEELKQVIEPSCAVPLAAILKSPKIFQGKKIGIVLTGGNIDLQRLDGWV